MNMYTYAITVKYTSTVTSILTSTYRVKKKIFPHSGFPMFHIKRFKHFPFSIFLMENLMGIMDLCYVFTWYFV